MASLIQNIAKGKRNAIIQSFEENKERVYYVANSVDKSQANKATLWAFKNAWNDIASTSNIREEDFTSLVIHKLANYLQRTSNKANKKDIVDTCEKLSIEFSMNKENITFPNDINDKVYETIDKIAPTSGQHDKTILIAVGCILAVVVGCVALISLSGSDDSNVGENTTMIGNEDIVNKPGYTSQGTETPSYQLITSSISAKLDPALTYYADIEIADYGKITVELDQKSAPTTVANFVGLSQSGFYDGLTFHRIIEGFMMQGGDPQGNGYGGSDENISGEFKSNGFDNPLSHTRGAISMARSNDPNSASSQFFICQEDCSDSLDGDYAVFGYVTSGIEVVDAVCKAAEPVDLNGTIPSSAQPVITSIKIRTEKAAE